MALNHDLHVRISIDDLVQLERVAAQNRIAVADLVRMLIRGMNPDLDLLTPAADGPASIVLSKASVALGARPISAGPAERQTA